MACEIIEINGLRFTDARKLGMGVMITSQPVSNYGFAIGYDSSSDEFYIITPQANLSSFGATYYCDELLKFKLAMDKGNLILGRRE